MGASAPDPPHPHPTIEPFASHPDAKTMAMEITEQLLEPRYLSWHIHTSTPQQPHNTHSITSPTPPSPWIGRGGKIWLNRPGPEVSYTSFLKQSTSEPFRRKFDEVILKEDEAWERS
jgi:hypothetical protein